jgi:anaerobic magnesium-protoporphyrin IX monomethyl ester cyclase
VDVLAVYPREPARGYFEKMPSLGMLWLGRVLGRAGYRVEFVDEQIDDRDVGVVAADLKPALVLVGGTSHTRFASFDCAARIKQAFPQTIVVYGGPHASFTADDTLTNVPAVDVVVRGEGEATCLELAVWVAAGGAPAGLARIAGISYREDGGVCHTAARPPIDDLDALGTPARELVAAGRYDMKMEFLDGVVGASVMTARGCPIACSFCSASAMFGPGYRMRSAAAVVDEVETLVRDYGVRGIKIFDSTFTLNRRHVDTFCDELSRRGLKLPWECEIRAGSVDKALLSKMQAAGCYYVDVGVESASQRVLDECIRKRIRVADAEATLKWCRELGLLTKVFFTLGHPGETYAEAKATNRFIWRNRRHIRLAGYHAGVKIYPGTDVERFARERDLLPPGFRWSAPYVNEDQRRLFRPVDNIPILLQSGLGLKELRRLRIGFILGRVASLRFVVEKGTSLLRSRLRRARADRRA